MAERHAPAPVFRFRGRHQASVRKPNLLGYKIKNGRVGKVGTTVNIYFCPGEIKLITGAPRDKMPTLRPSVWHFDRAKLFTASQVFITD